MQESAWADIVFPHLEDLPLRGAFKVTRQKPADDIRIFCRLGESRRVVRRFLNLFDIVPIRQSSQRLFKGIHYSYGKILRQIKRYRLTNQAAA